MLHCFPSKQFCYKRVLEWACILTGRKKENEKWILDTPLEIDTDRDLRPDKRKVNTSALKQNKTNSKKKKKRHCLLPPSDRTVAFSLSILNNTAVKHNVLCWIASPQSRQRTSVDTLVKSKGILKLSWQKHSRIHFQVLINITRLCEKSQRKTTRGVCHLCSVSTNGKLF